MKDCPKCRLVNPDTAERCDCGYDFPSGTMRDSYLINKGRRRTGGAVGALVVFFVCLRFTSLLGEVKRGDTTLAWAIGLFVLFVLLAAALYWHRVFPRKDSD